ncbi:GL25226 [Drosophila persimilis]|uniref:GL25226 n=1 Tax=Drosophila persimilis TaxID=7234 RepID=B4GRL8_DROPE|nr:GL25226 [Drosophila persimilis]
MDVAGLADAAVAAIESGVLLEDTFEALLDSVPVSAVLPPTSSSSSSAEAAATAADRDKKELELEAVELLVPGVMDDLVDSSDLDEEVRNFFL